MVGAAERVSGNAPQASITNSTNSRAPWATSKFDVVSFTRRFALGLAICRCESMREYTSKKTFLHSGPFGQLPATMTPAKRSTRVNPASCATTIAVFTRLGQLLPTASARAVEAIIFGNTFILKPIMPIGKAMRRRLNSSR